MSQLASNRIFCHKIETPGLPGWFLLPKGRKNRPGDQLKNDQWNRPGDHVSHIRELEASGENANEEIERLNKEVKKLTDKESPILKQGRILYDQVLEGKPINEWTIKEKRLFINYYKTIDYRTVSRLKNAKRREPLTDHNLLYLIMMEMYNQDESKVIKILNISENGMRTLKSRTRPVE